MVWLSNRHDCSFTFWKLNNLKSGLQKVCFWNVSGFQRVWISDLHCIALIRIADAVQTCDLTKNWTTIFQVAELPPAKRRKSDNDFSRPHLTGSCRTEGYYKMDPREKRRTKYHLQRPEAYEALSQQYRFANTEGSVTKAKGATSQSQSREARNNQRRQLAVLGDEAVYSDLLKFNQLKVIQ